ncbi:MAG: phosphatidylglycerol lysyltransferase domain-containing protein, partial [Planctomycetota bacterium]
MIAQYPAFSEISADMRPVLHPRFKALAEGISEFTFANIYLFRGTHRYRVSQLQDGLFVIAGRDGDVPFFMLPFGLPDEGVLRELFAHYGAMKAVSESHAEKLTALGYRVCEDRDNFDYLYSRADLVNLTGRKFHKKKNLLNMFIRNNECRAKPLLEEYRDDALQILYEWNH